MSFYNVFLGFSLNGELLVDPSAGDAAFNEVAGEDFVPACSLDIGQKVRVNFLHDVRSSGRLRTFLCVCIEGFFNNILT